MTRLVKIGREMEGASLAESHLFRPHLETRWRVLNDDGTVLGEVSSRTEPQFTGRRRGSQGWSKVKYWVAELPNGRPPEESTAYETRRDAVAALEKAPGVA